ncbi:MAG: TldD/PmbA family protein [Anaerolineae bacterium]|nr:TldD/PmbA family protein [Anaerolineae bacterium]NIN96917.1 TldD/PmbA family protein [Anaerolineae bacterium]NIQ79882.1 TldD/PmbA family protein [Anaerolineae bacterium]
MLGEDKIRERIEYTLSISKADQTEVVFMGQTEQLTRFANSHIHQNVAKEDLDFRVRVVVGKKIGIASTNDLHDAGLERALESAMTAARFQQDNPDFISLPEPQTIEETDGFVEGTAACTPQKRAEAVRSICLPSREHALNASGAFATRDFEYAVGNSLGVSAYYPTTLADLRAVIMSDSGAGYAAAASLDVEEIDAEAVGQEAIDKALRSRNPVDVPPGDYTVILEEYAVSLLLTYLAYMGFGAQALQEGRSFMAGKLGEKVAGENVSIWDDGLHPGNLPMPFDFEGVPKRRVDFITNGVARGVVYDSYSAGREEGKESTGHALPAPNNIGPFPWNVAMDPGDATKDEMLASTDRGLWVTRFHYVRPVHPLKTVVTGMTRDGTFLIEEGELVGPIKNLRFTQSILEALSAVEMIGRDTKIGREGFMENFIGGVRVPALKIGRFTFTSATEF